MDDSELNAIRQARMAELQRNSGGSGAGQNNGDRAGAAGGAGSQESNGDRCVEA